MNFVVQYFLPLFYATLLAWLLQRNKTFLQNGFSKNFIVFFFIAKCLAGIVYDYVSLKYIPKGGDIPLFYGDGLTLYKTFMQTPKAGFEQLRQMFGFSDIDLMNSHSRYINSVFEGIKFIYFFLDFFSFGNLYTDTIIFNGLAAFAFLKGGVFLIKHLKSNSAFAWLYLFPSTFFYTSAVFKEGLALILISAMLPLAYKLYTSFTVAGLIKFLVFSLLLCFFKFLIALTFLATMCLWWLLLKLPNHKKIIVLSFIVLSTVIFFMLKITSPKLDLPKYIVDRQHEFVALAANSEINVPQLKPNATSFAESLPAVLNNVFLKPLPGEGGKKMYLFFSLEIMLFWGLIIFLLVKNKLKANFGHLPALLWCLFLFGMANLLVIGYIIPNIGAITRYRSIFLPCIGLFFWMIFDGDRLLSLRFNKQKELITQ